VKHQADLTEKVGRVQHYGTALQLYYQKNQRFPSAYPAALHEDLAPYMTDPEVFNCGEGPDAGPEPLNRSYIDPGTGQGDRYVLSLEPKYDKDLAVVLFSDTTAEVAQQLPVLFNDAPAPVGSSATSGTIAFSGGSMVELADNTTVTVVQSIQANDGTPIHIIKQGADESGFLTTVAVGSDIVEVANDAALVFCRGGVADVQFVPGEEAFVDVATRSGEVVVDGRIIDRSQTVEGYMEEQENQGDVGVHVDDDHGVVVDEDCIATIRVLGKAITYGAGGPDCAVQAGAQFGDDADWEWLFNENQVYGDESYSREITGGTRVAVRGRASYGSWNRAYKSTVDHRQVLVLLNGDTPPQFAPFDHQPEITEFCAPVLDSATGKVTIEDHQALFLFELGTTNMSSPAADFQDLVLLVDFARIPGNTGSGPAAQNLAGMLNINPANNDQFEFTLEKPDGSVITRDDLLASQGSLEYTGPATRLHFKPKGNGNQNTVYLNGQVYPVHNGRVYTIVASDMRVHLFNDGNGNGAAMGRWWIDDMYATDAVISEESPGNGNGNDDGEDEEDDPDPGETETDNNTYAVTLAADGTLTVHQDASVGVRVLDTTLRNWRNRTVPIALKLRVNDSWHRIRRGRSVSAGYLHLQQVGAGSTLALKARSYNGWNSASYHSADGSGHVLTQLHGDTPSIFLGDDAPSYEDCMARAVDIGSGAVTLAANQVLMLFELGHEDLDDDDVSFQDLVVVLTFTPARFHDANHGNGFDGYGAADPGMGAPAAAFADTNAFAWAAIREVDLPPNGGGGGEDADDDAAEDDETSGDDEDTEENDGDSDENDSVDDDNSATYSDDNNGSAGEAARTAGGGTAAGWRSLGRGTTVLKGRKVRATRYH
jgi:hypothetical protein